MLLDLQLAEWLALQRAVLLLGPLVAAGALVLILKPTPRQATAAMVGFLWQLQALLVLNLVAAAMGWWRFATPANSFAGIPIDVWIGWAVWWGPVAVLLRRWIPVWVMAAASIAVDLVTMPILTPLVVLGEQWLWGEAAAIGLCLLPGLYAAHHTEHDIRPLVRARFHVLGFGSYMTAVLPVCALSWAGQPLASLYRLPASAPDWVIVAAALLLLFVGIAATAEFARQGQGTPIPYDPPKSVVATGPYAFNANPMQIIAAAYMALLALYAGSWSIGFIAAMFLVFDSIYANQYNREHIAHAMGREWRTYRGSVEDWRVRWRPYIEGRAEVTISPDGPAHRVWTALWPRLAPRLAGAIDVHIGEPKDFTRLTYRRSEAGIEDHGIRALGRILEHGPLPLAATGWLIRFPYLGGVLQRLAGLIILVYRRR